MFSVPNILLSLLVVIQVSGSHQQPTCELLHDVYLALPKITSLAVSEVCGKSSSFQCGLVGKLIAEYTGRELVKLRTMHECFTTVPTPIPTAAEICKVIVATPEEGSKLAMKTWKAASMMTKVTTIAALVKIDVDEALRPVYDKNSCEQL